MAGEGAREHARVVAEILARCGARDDCRIWGNVTGAGRALTHDGVVRFGLVGSADILGIFIGGIFLAFEVKTGCGRQTRRQCAFEKMIAKFGGHYYVVGGADEVEKILDGINASHTRKSG